MAVYKELEEKLKLALSDSDSDVKIKVDCYNGTVAAVSFYINGLKKARCGKTEVIGKASELKGTQVEFNGAANNPGDGEIKIEHSIYMESGNSITYTFPDDYTGAPPFDSDDENVGYKFHVNME